ncbi:MAG: ribonuclease HII [Oligoflexia bacterium]|nr:ribonuclease HII [Oligoflexia bacterium]
MIIAGVDEVGRGPLAGPVIAATVALVMDLKNFLNIDELFKKNKEVLAIMARLGITDSKKLTATKRRSIINKLKISDFNLISKDNVYEISYISSLTSPLSIHYSLSEISVEEIDKINILRASILAMNCSFNNIIRSTSTMATESGRHPLSGNNSALLLIDGNNKIDSRNFSTLYNKNSDNKNSEITEIPIIKGDQKSLIIALASIIAKEYRDNLMLNLSKVYPGYDLEKHAGYPTKQHKKMIEKLGPSMCHRKTFSGVKEFVQ